MLKKFGAILLVINLIALESHAVGVSLAMRQSWINVFKQSTTHGGLFKGGLNGRVSIRPLNEVTRFVPKTPNSSIKIGKGWVFESSSYSTRNKVVIIQEDLRISRQELEALAQSTEEGFEVAAKEAKELLLVLNDEIGIQQRLLKDTGASIAQLQQQVDELSKQNARQDSFFVSEAVRDARKRELNNQSAALETQMRPLRLSAIETRERIKYLESLKVEEKVGESTIIEFRYGVKDRDHDAIIDGSNISGNAIGEAVFFSGTRASGSLNFAQNTMDVIAAKFPNVTLIKSNVDAAANIGIRLDMSTVTDDMLLEIQDMLMSVLL